MKTIDGITTFLAQTVAPYKDQFDGGIYKGKRPTDSEKQDAVVSVLTGINGKFVQMTSINIRIFCEDIKQGKTYYPDTVQLGKFETLLETISVDLYNSLGYSFDYRTREINILQIMDDKVNQHVAVLAFDFKTN